jgi:excisionase family DNA binding protein
MKKEPIATHCQECGKPLPEDRRADKKFCNPVCTATYNKKKKPNVSKGKPQKPKPIENLAFWEKEFFSISEAAKYLKVTRATIYNYTKADRLVITGRNRGHIYFSRDALNKLLP